MLIGGWELRVEIYHLSRTSLSAGIASMLEEVRSATVLLSADVVYSLEPTQVFFEILDKIMAFGANKVTLPFQCTE